MYIVYIYICIYTSKRNLSSLPAQILLQPQNVYMLRADLVPCCHFGTDLLNNGQVLPEL